MAGSRAAEANEGAGLGLSVSKGIVDLHGGRMWAESPGPRGTSVVIEVPLAEAVSPPARPAPAG